MNPTQNSLIVLLWNSNGLARHRDELDILLHDKRIDIALLTETHFTDKSRFFIKDYVIYRTDHPDNTAHGGAAIIVKRTLSHFLLPPSSSNILQATSISVQFLSSSIVFSSSYWPPNKTVSQSTFLSYFHSLGSKFIAGGDYNAKHPKWGCRVANPRGKSLLSSLSSNNLQIVSPSEPTYWPTSPSKLPDILDVFITSRIPPSHHTIHTLPDLSSDHSPVLLTLSEFPLRQSSPPSLIRGHVDWEAFRKELDNLLSLNISLKTPNELDDAVQLLTQSIHTAILNNTIERHAPHSNSSLLPIKIRMCIAQKRRARNKWQRSRLPSDKKELNSLTNKLKQILRTYRQEKYSYEISQLTQTNKSLWTKTRQILKHKTSSFPLSLPNGNWARSDQEKADAFAHHLQNLYSLTSDDPTDDMTSLLDSPLPMSPPPKCIHPSDVTYSIRHLPNRKAPGYDLITGEILKQLPRKAIIFITYLYNAILRTTHFPILWKFSHVKMIIKPNKPPHILSSYRPISLLPILSKMFEKLLLKRIYPFLQAETIIPHHQFGFRAEHSTIQQCHRVIDTIATALEKGEYCTAAFLDANQAFDRVWHQGLLFKLKPILPSTYYLILKSYISNRFFHISHNSSVSQIFPSLSGVPQGSILAPILFIIYTSDIPSHPHTSLHTFADDTAILCRSQDPNVASRRLQNHLDVVGEWLRKWKFKVNVQKSVSITFTLRKAPCPPVFLDGAPLPPADVVKYLGLNIDKRLTWNTHAKIKRLTLKQRFLQLYRLLGRNSTLKHETKLILYKTLLRPIWTYGLELWGSTKPSNIYRIQSIQSKILRCIVNAPFYVSNLTLHTDLKIPFISDLAKSQYLSFHSKLPSHPNPLASSLATYTIPVRRLKRKWPRDLLPPDN